MASQLSGMPLWQIENNTMGQYTNIFTGQKVTIIREFDGTIEYRLEIPKRIERVGSSGRVIESYMKSIFTKPAKIFYKTYK